MPSPNLGEIILSQPWLTGSLTTIASSVIGLVGLVLQKAAQHQVLAVQIDAAGGQTWGQKKRLPRWWNLLLSPTYLLGVLLMGISYPLTGIALSYAPETTVAPLNAVTVVLNFALSYGFLNERFSKEDMRATCVCIGGMIVAIISMPRNVPGYMENFPTEEFINFSDHLLSNPGFMYYLIAWVTLLGICSFSLLSKTLSQVVKPLALPMLVGLFTAQLHFLSKCAGTLGHQAHRHPEIWEAPATFWIFKLTGLCFVVTMIVNCESLRHLDCRFFVPASFAASSVLMIVQGLFFFREWMLMSRFDLTVFTIACIVSVVGAVCVSPSHRRGPLDASAPGSPRERLLDGEAADPFLPYEAVLAIMDEHRVRVKQPVNAKPLQVCDLEEPQTGLWAVLRAIWRWMPICCCVGVLLLVVALKTWNLQFVAFAIMTGWGAHNGWKYGLHIALFSYVGQRKMMEFEKSDFQELHQLEEQERIRKGEPQPEGCPKWGEITHFVVLPNYKEDIEVLRLAIRSVASSKIARAQIGLVLAMEVREHGSKEKAAELAQEFMDDFKYVITTFHPPGIPGETPGKSSNVRWAGMQILEKDIPRLGLNIDHVVFTIADADSEFHPEYYSALTYYFVNGGCEEGQTPERYLSIYQPPILHYKNYVTQPCIVRLASFFTSQHELANLADPNAERVAYSTYSISARLAEAVKGWDPDWISEDWHMTLKCFLATAGRVRIQSIPLGVINYAPEGENYWETIVARWTQAKRHALGFSELVFFQDHWPRVLASITDRQERSRFMLRSFWIWSRCLLIHLTMASTPFIGPITGYCILYFLQHQIFADLNSWTFLTFCVFQSTGIISFIAFMYTNVLLYELASARCDSPDDFLNGIVFRCRGVHFLFVMITSMMLMPPFFVCGAMAEWIAALKTARTHKFHYEVALKPNLSGSMTGSQMNLAGSQAAR
eukprot:gnl/TRDRNA2_/TRDRNA2_126991_c0_seq1.p1 gnl/TRDRNA2_/TRDRNA2_126991_c0~~gnl/TRDRNA2_/TRDRNA2_126991_c0_seq1.p1  ORF type:complete len:945 (-),score=155.32 gnl/TRDRNA2_/TRDRNA2_126991_c0_seq1:293-3127(-)